MSDAVKKTRPTKKRAASKPTCMYCGAVICRECREGDCAHLAKAAAELLAAIKDAERALSAASGRHDAFLRLLSAAKGVA